MLSIIFSWSGSLQILERHLEHFREIIFCTDEFTVLKYSCPIQANLSLKFFLRWKACETRQTKPKENVSG